MSPVKKPPFVLPKRARTAEEWASEAEISTKLAEDEFTAASTSTTEAVETLPPVTALLAHLAPAQTQAAPVSDRVMKRQVNIEVPETLHRQLKAFVKTLPDMNMTKFLLIAAQKEMVRLEKERGG